jgi:hypothetical protein
MPSRPVRVCTAHATVAPPPPHHTLWRTRVGSPRFIHLSTAGPARTGPASSTFGPRIPAAVAPLRTTAPHAWHAVAHPLLPRRATAKDRLAQRPPTRNSPRDTKIDQIVEIRIRSEHASQAKPTGHLRGVNLLLKTYIRTEQEDSVCLVLRILFHNNSDGSVWVLRIL